MGLVKPFLSFSREFFKLTEGVRRLESNQNYSDLSMLISDLISLVMVFYSFVLAILGDCRCHPCSQNLVH